MLIVLKAIHDFSLKFKLACYLILVGISYYSVFSPFLHVSLCLRSKSLDLTQVSLLFYWARFIVVLMHLHLWEVICVILRVLLTNLLFLTYNCPILLFSLQHLNFELELLILQSKCLPFQFKMKLFINLETFVWFVREIHNCHSQTIPVPKILWFWSLPCYYTKFSQHFYNPLPFLVTQASSIFRAMISCKGNAFNLEW